MQKVSLDERWCGVGVGEVQRPSLKALQSIGVCAEGGGGDRVKEEAAVL